MHLLMVIRIMNMKKLAIGMRMVLVDVSKFCFDASLNVVGHKKYVSTDASDGSSREKTFGQF